MIRVQAEPFDAAVETAALMERTSHAGAVASFIGMVRPSGHGGAVGLLELEHHPTFTLSAIEAIGSDAVRRFALLGLSIVHRHGDMEPGEAIVFVGAAASHRRAAFEAVDYLMDRLKVEGPFWKRERGPEGARWIEPSRADVADRARWDIAETDNARS